MSKYQSSKSDTQDPMGLNVKREWIIFFSVLGNPLALLLLVCTGIFIWYTTAQSSNTPTTTNAILTVIISLLSGLVGGILAKRWDDINETGKLITKGRSAVRGLRYLSYTIDSLDNRIATHVLRISDTSEQETLAGGFQELGNLCNLIQEGVISAIEEWKDIVPEVSSLFSEIGVITELKNQKDILKSGVDDLKIELAATQESSADERNALELRLTKKETELREVQDMLSARQSPLATGIPTETPTITLTPTGIPTETPTITLTPTQAPIPTKIKILSE